MFVFFLLSIAFATTQSDTKCKNAHCSNCTETECTNCIPNFILVNGECINARDAVEHCHYARNGVCINCFHGYYLHENKCVKADKHCDDYKNGTCVECDDGYYLQNNECIKCSVIGCEKCSQNIETCDECIKGYVLENNTCVKPVDFCEKYEHHHHHHKHHEKCLKCLDGYRLVNGKCLTIEEANCRRWENDTCVQCWGPYRPIDGKCTQEKAKVIDHCIEYDDDEFECEVCEDGYVALHDYDDKDFDDEDDDHKPHFPEDDSEDDHKPDFPFFPDEDSEDNKPDFPFFPDQDSEDDHRPDFPFNPNKPNEEGSEDDYKPRPFKNMRRKRHHHSSGCVKCSAKCKTCSGTPSNCLTCSEGYYQNERGQCQSCPILRGTCSGYKTELLCTSCNSGCAWNNGTCINSNCISYETKKLGKWNYTVCDKCEEGYVLDSLRKICVQVEGGCSATFNGKCVECAPGYFMTKDFKCEKCAEPCKTCVFNSTTCLSCYESNETLSTASCNKCLDEKCAVCDEDTMKCKQCIDNYVVDEFGFCKMGCYTEDCDGKCTMCSEKENEIEYYYQPTAEGRCFKYAEMPTNPEKIIDGSSSIMILVILALLTFLF